MRLRILALFVVTAVTTALLPAAAALASGPTAALSVYNVPTTSGSQVSVYGYNSCCNITNYQFDFGDGNSISQSSPYAYHTYYNYGSTPTAYTIRLTVTDNTGTTASTSLTETVNPDYAPIAHLTLSTNTSDSSGLAIYADASASTDADSFSPPYEFDFYFGDGGSASSYNSGVVGHKYAAAGTYTVTVYVYDTQYNSSTQSQTTSTITVPSACGASCSSLPTAPSATKLKMILPSTVSTTGAFPIQVVIAPAASTPVPICQYQVDKAVNGVWTTVTTQAGLTYNSAPWSPGPSILQYRTWSIGCNSNRSLNATASTTFRAAIYDQNAFAYAGTWTRTSDANAYAGAFEKTTTVGASATFTATLNNMGIVAQKSPAGGQISIYVDGVLKGTANLYASSVKERQIVFKWGAAPPVGTHTIKVVLSGAGTTGGKTFALDGLAAIAG